MVTNSFYQKTNNFIDKINNESIKKSIVLFALSIIIIVINIFIHKMIIFNYKSFGFEIYTLALTWFTILGIPIFLGSRLLFLKINQDRKLLWSSFIVFMFLGLLFSILLGSVLKIYFIKTLDLKYLSFISNGIILFLFSNVAVKYLSFYLNAIKKPIISKIFEGLFPILMIVSCLFFLPYYNLFFLYGFAYFVSVFIGLLYVIIKNKESISWIIIKSSINRKIIYENFSLGFSEAIFLAASKISLLFIAYISHDLKDMAMFNIALSLSSLSLLIVTSINIVYGPELRNDIKNNNLDNLRDNFRFIKIVCICFSVLFLILLLVIGQFFIEYFYTSNYLKAYDLLIILLIGQVGHSFFGPVGLIANLSGHHNYTAFLKLVSVLFMLLFIFLTYNNLGVFSAAIAYALSLFIWNILTYNKIKYLI